MPIHARSKAFSPPLRAGRRSFARALLFGGISLFVASVRTRAHAEGVDFQVIVNRKNPLAKVSREFVADAFLGKASHWPNGKALRPADLRADSATRAAFSRDVIRRTVAAVRRHWQQRIFSGQGVPPPEFESDERVIAYVEKHEGAIGYVSPAAALGGTKAVLLG